MVLSLKRGHRGGTSGLDRKIDERLAILILVPGVEGKRPVGPEIRGIEIARALASRHRVTVSFGGDPSTSLLTGLRVVGAGRRQVLREALRHSVVMAPWPPPFLIPVLRALGATVVSDLYDPIEHELDGPDGELESVRRLTEIQLRFADLLVCGGARQRDHIAREASRLHDAKGQPSVVVVPFGLPERPAPVSDHPLRESLGLDATDLVVLWWGSLWRWLDPLTAIEAMAVLSDRRPELKLVFSAGVPPDPATHSLLCTDAARERATALGLLGETVLFMDRWIAYDQRHRFLADADLGITLHTTKAEAERAARARYLDYLWCSLPCLLSAGDEFSEKLAGRGFAALVEPGDVAATAAALELFTACPERLEAAARGGEALALEYRWSLVVEPLVAAFQDAVGRSGRRPWGALRSVPAVLGYYVRRALGLARPSGSIRV